MGSEMCIRDRNIIGDSSSNAVWQFHADLLFKNKMRISINYLLDEFVLDQDIEIGKDHGRAYSLRLAYILLNNQKFLFSVYLRNIYVGTPTFRHGYGSNNFVQKGIPLGWELGSDSKENSIGFNFSNRSSFLLKVNFGLLNLGGENIIERAYEPYKNYLEGTFPSGNVNNIFIISQNLDWMIGNNIRLSLINNTLIGGISNFIFGIDIQMPNLIGGK